MVVSQANDSYFWVVTGMTVKEGYKLRTLGTLAHGFTAAAAIWLISMVAL